MTAPSHDAQLRRRCSVSISIAYLAPIDRRLRSSRHDEGRPHGRPSGLGRPVCRALASPTPWSAVIVGAYFTPGADRVVESFSTGPVTLSQSLPQTDESTTMFVADVAFIPLPAGAPARHSSRAHTRGSPGAV